jgi:hypothetical protein
MPHGKNQPYPKGIPNLDKPEITIQYERDKTLRDWFVFSFRRFTSSLRFGANDIAGCVVEGYMM